MPVVSPPTVAALPTPPSTASPSTFDSRADAFLGALPTFQTDTNAVAANVAANATDAAASATAAAAQVPLAAAQVTLAQNQVTLAQNQVQAATSAANAAGATLWVSGTTYAIGDARYSPVNMQTYRRTTSGAGTTDPSIDTANWLPVAYQRLPRIARSSNDIITLADLSKLFDITSGTFTQTFSPSNTLGGGWWCYVRNSGTGIVTLDPDGAETIDGAATRLLRPNECRIVQSDGANLTTFDVVSASGGLFQSPANAWDLNGLNFVASGSPSTLPDLTTVGPRFGLITQATAAATLTLTTSDGWTVTQGSYNTGTPKVAAPTYTFTPHGLWTGGTLTPPNSATGLTIGTFNLLTSLQLSSTLHILFYADGAANTVCAVAYNPVTKLCDVNSWYAAEFSNVLTPAGFYAYATSATSFALFYNNPSNIAVIRGFTVSGTTITSGTPYTGSVTSLYGEPAQLSPTLFIFEESSSMFAVTVVGTTVTVGAGATTGTTLKCVAPVSATSALICYPTAALAATTLTFRVATVSGTTITMGATYTTSNSGFRGNFSGGQGLYALGSSFVAFSSLNATTTTAQLVAATVSGTVVTLGTPVTVALGTASNLSGALLTLRNWSVATRNMRFDRIARHDANTIIVKPESDSETIYAVTATGTTVNVGAKVTVTGATTGYFAKDPAGNTYISNASQFSRYTVSGTTITVAETVSSAANVFLSDSVNDVSVKYGGTWYAWRLGAGTSLLPNPTNAYPATPTTALSRNASDIRAYGDIA